MPYRPNRIGPWPLADIDAALVSVADTTLEAGLATIASPPEVYMVGSSVATEYRAESFLVSGSLGVTAGNGIGIGVRIAGTALQNARNYIVSMAGSIVFHSSQIYCHAVPIFGRAADVTDGIISLSNHWIPPFNASWSNIAAASSFACVNHQMVVGDFVPSGTEGANPLVAGWYFRNGGGSTAEVTHIRAMISLQRYLSDIPVFEPNM